MVEVFDMIRFVCGIKGAGKTKRMVDMANAIVQDALGKVVFVDDTSERMFDLKHSIRLVDAKEYNITNQEQFFGFVAGIIAGDFDIHTLFVDHFLRIVKDAPSQLIPMLTELDCVLDKQDVRVIFSMSADAEGLPSFYRERLEM
jgi:hypothetical protein